jgi:co-chaperonin GroES (HSP10)
MSELENAREMVEREGIKATKMEGVLIADDGSNECVIPGFPYRFKAQGDKLLVSVDVFKSGYECKTCKGAGTIKLSCLCEGTDRPGYKYSSSMLEGLDDVMFDVRSKMNCPSCGGDYLGARKDFTCTECNGKGALIWIPDQSKLLPTTGVIVSVGSEVTNAALKNHTRVLFGAYSGTMIPTKAPGVVFKVIRDIEVLLVIEGGEDLAAFDFVQIDDKP